MRLFLVFCVFLCSEAESVIDKGGETVTFNFSNFNPEVINTHYVHKYINVTTQNTQISVLNLTSEVAFVVIQVHSFIDDVTLSLTPSTGSNTSITGTNIGLVSLDKKPNFYVKSESNTVVLVLITAYTREDPMPGGCNLSFQTEIAPYQIVSYTDDLVNIKSQAPSFFNRTCEKNPVQVEMYHLYLKEYNYDSAHYFETLTKMLTVDSIRSNGYKESEVSKKYDRLYGNYEGMGRIFAMIATYEGKSSAYVSTVSYGCNIKNPDANCYGPKTSSWKFMCGSLLVIGLILTFASHVLLPISMFFTSFSVFSFLTYLFQCAVSDYDGFTVSIVIGIIAALVCVFCGLSKVWCLSPLLLMGGAFIAGAFVITSASVYGGPADWYHDGTFWSMFFGGFIVCFIVLGVCCGGGHVLACSIIGGYCFIVPLNYYFGGALQYIVINVFRRMTIKKFNSAITDPPFQVWDVVFTITWINLALAGVFVQIGTLARSRTEIETDETTPLIYE